MKAKDLAKLLLEHPDFDVQFNTFSPDGSEWGATLHSFEITGVGDIGYTDKVFILCGNET